jgi:serine/threonine-protein kinase
MFSPDGRWIAYSSNESGQFEIFVRPFPGPGGKWQISTGGGVLPRWSRSSRELFYSGAGLTVVPYSISGDVFAAGQPRSWFGKAVPPLADFDLTPDGKRLAAVMSTADASAEGLTHVTFLLNFADELRQKLPSGK